MCTHVLLLHLLLSVQFLCVVLFFGFLIPFQLTQTKHLWVVLRPPLHIKSTEQRGINTKMECVRKIKDRQRQHDLCHFFSWYCNRNIILLSKCVCVVVVVVLICYIALSAIRNLVVSLNFKGCISLSPYFDLMNQLTFILNKSWIFTSNISTFLTNDIACLCQLSKQTKKKMWAHESQ